MAGFFRVRTRFEIAIPDRALGGDALLAAGPDGWEDTLLLVLVVPFREARADLEGGGVG